MEFFLNLFCWTTIQKQCLISICYFLVHFQDISVTIVRGTNNFVHVCSSSQQYNVCL